MATDRYGSVAKWLHWLIAAIVIVMLIFGRTLESMPIAERTEMIMGHSGLGTLVLVLMLVRLAWRLGHPPPPSVDMPGWQERLSAFAHRAFYVLLLLQPLLGIGQATVIDYPVVAFGLIDYSALAEHSTGTFRVFHIAHSVNAWLLSVLVVVHAGAALFHHFFQKDDVLRRMLPFGKPRGNT